MTKQSDKSAKPQVLNEDTLDKVAGGDAHKETIEIASWSLGASNPTAVGTIKAKPRP